MNDAQIRYYRGLWADVRKVLRAGGMSSAECEIERHAIHVRALGFDKSSVDLTNAEFDRVKGAFFAICRPADYETQIRQMRMGKIRLQVSIAQMLAALEEPDDYALAIVRRMNRGGRIGQPLKEDRAYVRDGKKKVYMDYAHTRDGTPVRRELILDELCEAELMKVIVALKKECRRRWRLKEDLLKAVEDCWQMLDLDASAATAAIVRELNWPMDARLEIGRLVYEDLIRVLAALRKAAGVAPRFAIGLFEAGLHE